MKGGKNQNAILIMVLHKVYSSTLLLHAVSRVPCVLCRMPCDVCRVCVLPKKISQMFFPITIRIGQEIKCLPYAGF